MTRDLDHDQLEQQAYARSRTASSSYLRAIYRRIARRHSLLITPPDGAIDRARPEKA